MGAKLGKSKSLIDRWSATHDWVRRARQHDEELERAEAEARLRAMRAIDRRHVALAAELVDEVVAVLRSGTVASMRPGELIRLLDVAARIERVAGESGRAEPLEQMRQEVRQFNAAVLAALATTAPEAARAFQRDLQTRRT